MNINKLHRDSITVINGSQLEELRITAFRESGVPFVQRNAAIVNSYQQSLLNINPGEGFFAKIQELIKPNNLLIVNVNDSYTFRPDLLSYIFYGTDYYFESILILNGFKSLMEFNPSERDNSIYVFKPDVISEFLSE